MQASSDPSVEQTKFWLMNDMLTKCQACMYILRPDEEDFIKQSMDRKSLTRREWRTLHQIYSKVKNV